MKLLWPTESRRVTSPFGPRQISRDGFHDGIDIALIDYPNDMALACADGIIRRSYISESYGNCIVVEHQLSDGPLCVLYAHLKKRFVFEGNHVKAKQELGILGNTGWSQGAHLHFEIRLCSYKDFWIKDGNKYKYAVDPLKYLEKELNERDPNLAYLVEHKPPIFDSEEYWQHLIDNKANMSAVPVEIFINVIKKVVERD